MKKEILILILATLLKGKNIKILECCTDAAAVSQTVWRGTGNGIIELFAEGATYIRLGGHHVGNRPTFYFFLILNKKTGL